MQMKNAKHDHSLWQTFNYSVVYSFSLITLFILFHVWSYPSYQPASPLASGTRNSASRWDPADTHEHVHAENPSRGIANGDLSSFQPLKDVKYPKTSEMATSYNTWFMSSWNDTLEKDEAGYLRFPSKPSGGRLLCLKGHDVRDGSRNFYALARPNQLPDNAVFLKGLAFVSDSYYDYKNLWHSFGAVAPFLRWSMNNGCAKPSRWVLYHWGELRDDMGSWVRQLLETIYGEVGIEKFDGLDKDKVHCYEEAVVMRHNMAGMGHEQKLKVCNLLRCRARRHCRIKGRDAIEVNDRGEPLLRLTLLMRRGSRSFKNATAVINAFAEECSRVSGCILNVVQSEELNFCDQVRVLTGTDIVASPHGAQLTNMLFMDRGSSVMEFFPKGWLELAGLGQYAHHWLANLSGMKHRGAWWEPLEINDCPNTSNDIECFTQYYKDGKVGHNSTHFAMWAREVLNQVMISKREELSAKSLQKKPSLCAC